MSRPAEWRWLVVGGAAVVAALVVGAVWLRGSDDTAESRGGAAVETTATGGTTATTGTAGASSPAAGAPAGPTSGQDVATGQSSAGRVDVMITQAGWGPAETAVEVSGFVSGIVEDGGTCRVTLTRRDETVTADGEAFADASTTMCGAISLGGVDMTSGWWQAVLSYESTTSTGASDPVDVLVPTR